MPAVIAEPSARRAPRTSRSMQVRASTTLTLAPSHRPSARSRHASASPQRTASTVARDPLAQAASGHAPAMIDVAAPVAEAAAAAAAAAAA